MKIVSALVDSAQLPSVREALVRSGFTRITLIDAHTHVRPGRTGVWRGHSYVVDLDRRCRIEVTAEPEDAPDVARILLSASRGLPGAPECVWIADVDLITISSDSSLVRG